MFESDDQSKSVTEASSTTIDPLLPEQESAEDTTRRPHKTLQATPAMTSHKRFRAEAIAHGRATIPPNLTETTPTGTTEETDAETSEDDAAVPLTEADIALKSIPDSILDEIKINAPLSEASLSKARHRQELFLRKRRKSKRQSILMSRVMVAVRLLMSALLLGLWLYLWQSPFFDFKPEQTYIRFESDSGQGFLNLVELHPLLKPYSGQRIYNLSPAEISSVIKRRFTHVQEAVVRRQIWPLRLDITIVEKPIWGTYYRLADNDHSSLDRVLGRYAVTYPGSNPAFARPSSKPFRYVTLMHAPEGASRFELSQLTPAQKQVLVAYPAIFIQGRDLDSLQRKSLEEVLYVIKTHSKRFEKQGYSLRCVDARNPDDVFLVFNGFQARLGRLDYTASRRTNRLVQLLDTIHRYESQLAWVELSWQGQITFKLK